MSIRGAMHYLQENQIIFALVLIAAIWLIVVLHTILLILFIAYIILTAILPMVTFLRKKLPKFLAIVITYIVFFALFSLLIIATLPFLVLQMQFFANDFPTYISRLEHMFHISIQVSAVTNYLTSQLANIGRNTYAIATNVFTIIFSLFTIIIISFYLLYDYDRIIRDFLSLFHSTSRTKVMEVIYQIEKKLGAWVRGQLFLCIIIGIVAYIAYTIIQLPFALPLAIIAGVFELIPTIGPFLGAIPAVLVALTISPLTALFVVIAYIVIQILENNFLVPKIMQQATSLHPIIIICAIIIGSRLMGIVGALLAVPFVSFITIIVYATLRDDY